MSNNNKQKPTRSVPKLEYVGRFAPSPTGPLHFGSLIAATASYLQARANRGLWRLRIDDLDGPRCNPQWNNIILHSLESFGFEWHGDVVYQSQQRDAYRNAAKQLVEKALLFNCSCSRKQLARTAERGDAGLIYPGYCRQQLSKTAAAVNECSQRLKVGNALINFNDGWQGQQQRQLGNEDGDFIIWRRDGLPAYQLAVVVDDAAMEITEVVRGIDLLNSTPKQVYVQQQLDLPTPAYRHVAIAVDASGTKISKETGAPALNDHNPAPELYEALVALKQQPPADMPAWKVGECWDWAVAHWRAESLNGLTTMPLRSQTS